MRVIWIIAGLLSTLIGVIGIFLPLLPTVPLLLLAAFCFARGSERLHHWLITHPKLGPPIQDWNKRGAIGLKAKKLATLSVIAAFLLSVWMGVPLYALLMQAAVLVCVMIFIWTRPSD